MANDIDYIKKEEYVHQMSVDWRRGHIYSLLIRENFECDGNGSVLHVGCNAMTTSVLLSETYKSVVPCDIQLDPVKAGKNLRRSDKGVVCNVTSLPFSDESFDFIYALDIIEHLYGNDKGVFISEMSRVLRSGGIAYVFTPYQRNHNCKEHVNFFMDKDDLTYWFLREFRVLKCEHETRENPKQGICPGKHSAWNLKCKKL